MKTDCGQKIIVLSLLWRVHRTITAINNNIYIAVFILGQGERKCQMMTFGVSMLGSGRSAKIRCKSKGLLNTKVSMTGDTVSKMHCVSVITAELAREICPDDKTGQIDIVKILAETTVGEVMKDGI